MWPRAGQRCLRQGHQAAQSRSSTGDLPRLHWTFQQIIGGAGSILGPPNARALGGAGGCRAHGDLGRTEALPLQAQDSGWK